MSCCDIGAYMAMHSEASVETDNDALEALSRKLADGSRQLEFAVPDAHCAACIRSIETGLAALPQVELARVNLTKRRVRIVYDSSLGAPSDFTHTITASGYHNYVLDGTGGDSSDPVLGELIRALAVSGFAAGNIMLFSVSVWSGAADATRDLFHWVSALIALPAIVYAGSIFFRSAWRALRVGKTNMDVPISIGVILASGLSLFETFRSAEHAYFDATTTLLFFLLIGRTLDHLMRERARNAIVNLARLQPRGAMRVLEDGRREYVRLEEISPGTLLELKAGERLPVDGMVMTGGAVFDYSIVTGETKSHPIAVGEVAIAGAMNLDGPIQVRAERVSADSYLARMAAMMEAAEAAKTRPRRIADRAAAIYAPVVHTLAAATFLGWLVFAGDWHTALINAVAVLIITCPCALALAVPIAHVVAAGRLFERGILMKDGAALERAAEIDSVAFDKTGTLTIGRPRLVDDGAAPTDLKATAAALAFVSGHPLSRALVEAFGPVQPFAGEAREVAGQGIEGKLGNDTWRLGNALWCGAEASTNDLTTVWLSRNGVPVACFGFEDIIRADARSAVAQLQALDLPVRLLSGDADPVVRTVQTAAGITEARSGLQPEDKVADVERGKTMMIGDGINDAPALRAAHVSMAPTTAADIGRSAADFVFTGDKLDAVPFVVGMARRAAAIVRQNLVLAIGYNAIAVPLAISGQVTPLIAAIAMSSSSLLVVANALRLRFALGGGKIARRSAVAVRLKEQSA